MCLNWFKKFFSGEKAAQPQTGANQPAPAAPQAPTQTPAAPTDAATPDDNQ